MNILDGVRRRYSGQAIPIEMEFSSDSGFMSERESGDSNNGFRRRAFTNEHSFGAAKEWFFKRANPSRPRRSIDSSSSSDESNRGSLGALYSSQTLGPMCDQLSVLVIGCKSREENQLVKRLLSLCSGGSEDSDVGIIRDADGAIKHLRFIQVDSERDNLWLTLRANGYIFVYRVGDTRSFRAADAALGLMRHSRGEHNAALWIVGLTEQDSCIRSMHFQEARTMCRLYHCQWMEIMVNGDRETPSLSPFITSPSPKNTKPARFSFERRRSSVGASTPAQLLSSIIAVMSETGFLYKPPQPIKELSYEKSIFESGRLAPRKISQSCSDMSKMFFST